MVPAGIGRDGRARIACVDLGVDRAVHDEREAARTHHGDGDPQQSAATSASLPRVTHGFSIAQCSAGTPGTRRDRSCRTTIAPYSAPRYAYGSAKIECSNFTSSAKVRTLPGCLLGDGPRSQTELVPHRVDARLDLGRPSPSRRATRGRGPRSGAAWWRRCPSCSRSSRSCSSGRAGRAAPW